MQKYITKSDFANLIETAKTPNTNYPIEWNIWATFTTQYNLSLPSCRRAISRYFQRLHEWDSAICWVAESFDLKDGQHAHAVVKSDVPYDVHRELWNLVTNAKEYRDMGFRTHFQKYNPKLGASHYLGKYMDKKHNDWDIWHWQTDNNNLDHIPSDKKTKHHKRTHLVNGSDVWNDLEHSKPITIAKPVIITHLYNDN